MKRVHDDYLHDMLENAEKALSFVEGMDYDEFEADDKAVYAVIRAFEIIGEAAKNIPKPLQAEYNEVPWQDMAKLRDKISHFYFGVKYEIVWKVVRERLPSIKMAAGKMLKDLSGEKPIKPSIEG